MIYKQATAEVILFDNSDVITTSGTDCKNHGHETADPKCHNDVHLNSHNGFRSARPRY